MRYIIIVFLLLMICSASAENFYDVKYISNYDGDTIRFDLGEDLPEIFRFMPLRLYGIDTKEIRSKSKEEKQQAIEARDFVKNELSKAKMINLVDCKNDKYFRINCRVNYDEKDLTDELLKNGHGYKYYGGKKIK